MNRIVKKVVAFSLIGLMQAGLFAPVVTEAASSHKHKHKYRYEHCDKERLEKIKAEKRRHAEAMKRLAHEKDWEYEERMKREKEHHEEIMRMLGGLAILQLILNNDNHD